MARPKTASTTAARASSGKATRSAGTAVAGSVTCPECDRTFARAAALGAHRRQAHGVVGATAQVRRNRSRKAPTSGRLGRTRTGTANRDMLLQALFPNGVPPQEAVIRAVNRWLDEADRLSKLAD
jgi:hypothetical protein